MSSKIHEIAYLKYLYRTGGRRTEPTAGSHLYGTPVTAQTYLKATDLSLYLHLLKWELVLSHVEANLTNLIRGWMPLYLFTEAGVSPSWKTYVSIQSWILLRKNEKHMKHINTNKINWLLFNCLFWFQCDKISTRFSLRFTIEWHRLQTVQSNNTPSLPNSIHMLSHIYSVKKNSRVLLNLSLAIY